MAPHWYSATVLRFLTHAHQAVYQKRSDLILTKVTTNKSHASREVRYTQKQYKQRQTDSSRAQQGAWQNHASLELCPVLLASPVPLTLVVSRAPICSTIATVLALNITVDSSDQGVHHGGLNPSITPLLHR